jgi:lipoate-protein ligase A
MTEAPGQIQMAIDSYLLSMAYASESTVFRVYRMTPPAVTIGRHQRWRRVIDEDACRVNGWDWARRPTGGGALLHRDEINYAVIAPRGVLAPQGQGEFRAVFDVIGRALTLALEEMGHYPELRIGDRDSHAPQHGLCGRSITGNEIALGERKIIAAAQEISPAGILQHGTIYLRAPNADDRFWPSFDTLPSEAEEFVQRWADLGPSFHDHCWSEVAGEFEQGFRQNFPAKSMSCRLTDDDWTRIGQVINTWNATGWHKSR